MGNTTVRETQLLGDALDSIARLLPASWSLNERAGVLSEGERLDAVVELVGPNGARVSLVAEAKRSGSVPAQLLLAALRERAGQSGMQMLFASDYIGPTLREALTAEGFSFADATGWVRVSSDDPLVLLTGHGAERSPRVPRGSAVTRLNGIAASRTIRALAIADMPLGVRGLAGLADVSPGSVSKLLVTLASEGIVDRDESGSVLTVRRRALIRRWTADYSFTRANRSVSSYISPRGLERALARLGERANVALTGSAAARRLLPESATSVVPLRFLAMYTDDPAALANELRLVDADATTANVVIARPQDTDVLRSPEVDGLVVAPLALVIADLLTLPGRSDAEAEQLMDALASADEAWKE